MMAANSGSFAFASDGPTETCVQDTITWFWNGAQDALFDLAISPSISPATDTATSEKRATAKMLLASSLDASSLMWTWPSVNVTQGTYRFSAVFAGGQTVTSLPFSVENGTDVSCLGVSKPPISPIPTTSTSTPSTSSSTFASTITRPPTAVVPDPTASSSVKSHTGAIAGGVIGGTALFVGAIVAFWLFMRRRRRPNPPTSITPTEGPDMDVGWSNSSTGSAFTRDEKSSSSLPSNSGSLRLEPNRRSPSALALTAPAPIPPTTPGPSCDIPVPPPPENVSPRSVPPSSFPLMRKHSAMSALDNASEMSVSSETQRRSYAGSWASQTIHSPTPSSATSQMYFPRDSVQEEWMSHWQHFASKAEQVAREEEERCGGGRAARNGELAGSAGPFSGPREGYAPGGKI